MPVKRSFICFLQLVFLLLDVNNACLAPHCCFPELKDTCLSDAAGMRNFK